ncbi:MAG: SpaH/EbpB family LPXTG-anchored major pilin [Andreesenia angusta]|nr:SpaH/EbpB family LPXTG-anchored major pilin [Andreesenia angusta]
MKESFLKKLISILAVLTLVFSTVLSFSGEAVEEYKSETKTVTLHKLLLDNLDEWTTPEEYDASSAIANANEIPGVYFAWQNEDGEWINSQGNTTDDEGNQITKDNAFGGLTTATGKVFDTSKLPIGKYKIVEISEKSTYIGPNGENLTGSKAVPVEIKLSMYNKDGLVTDAHVYPKNTSDKPGIDKEPEFNSDKDIGDSVNYTIKTDIPANAKYKVLKWTDNMSEGLDYNKDLKITIGTLELVKDTDYTITETDRGFTAILTETGLNKVNGKEEASTIILKYSAIINESATEETPGTNDITLTYGNNPDSTEDIKDDDVPGVETYGKKFVKTDDNGTGLKDAEFYVYKDIDGTKEYLYINDEGKYEWLDASENATVFTSGANGEFEIKGLAAGDYFLEEKKAPEGYAKLQGPIKFNVGKGTYAQEAASVINKEVVIPETGGFGTILFTLAGLGLISAAFLIFKKKGNIV